MSGQILNIGVDVGGTNIKVGLLDECGSILCQKRLATQPELGPEAVIGNIAEAVRAVLSERGMKPGQMNSIGIGVPGTTDADTGIVIYAPNIFWRDVPVGPMLHSTFGVPVYATQDTRAAAWAEYLVGKGQGLGSVASITLGTGIGCGLVFDGKIFHGAMNTAGEFGHQLVE
ncbi:MAG: ROK family protein, partial [Acidobacteriaceae bacterium]|nr:ROK family protein [Acidobacteriaceae bacterium]